MIRVILESPAGELAVVGHFGNEVFLCQSSETHFPLLSQVDNVSYAVFSRADMPELLSELKALPTEAVKCINEVIGLARRCHEEPETMLTFTPFT